MKRFIKCLLLIVVILTASESVFGQNSNSKLKWNWNEYNPLWISQSDFPYGTISLKLGSDLIEEDDIQLRIIIYSPALITYNTDILVFVFQDRKELKYQWGSYLDEKKKAYCFDFLELTQESINLLRTKKIKKIELRSESGYVKIVFKLKKVDKSYFIDIFDPYYKILDQQQK